MSLGQKLRKLDIYPKLPKDLSEGTNIGGLMSVLTVVVISYFLYSQLKNYLYPISRATMAEDQYFTRNEMRIHLDIEFPRLPCEIISLDLQDVMMSHHPNIASVKKWRLDKNGNFLDQRYFELLEESSQIRQYQIAKQAFQQQRGCRLIGSFTVKEVPGNFHISSHAYQNIYMRLSLENVIHTLDVSHKIHKLFFGELENIEGIQSKHPEAVLSPLNGHQLIYDMTDTPHSYTSHYHLDIVPTRYQQGLFTSISAFQYVYHHNTFEVPHMPVLYFNYHIGGLTVFITPDRASLLAFLVKLCAIIGGTYAMASFLDAFLNRLFATKTGYSLIQ